MSEKSRGDFFKMPEEDDNKAERETLLQSIEVAELAPNGLGFGEGSISAQEQLNHPEISGLTTEAFQKGREIILSGTPFRQVEAADDGCGDGRPAAETYSMEDGEKVVYNTSLNRAKVFGGGVTVASSMYRTAVAGKPQKGETVLKDREYVADKLDEAGITYGGHIDNHAHGDNCGCGAIDRYPTITVNALKYRNEITNTLRAVYGDEFKANEAAINAVFEIYEDQVEAFDEYFVDAEGSKTKKLMEDRGSVIKQLNDEHLEDFLVVNKVEGVTFDQRAFDKEMREQGVEGTAQAFVVDEWRGRMYADFIADLAKEQDETVDRDYVYKKAYADFWIRTLAVSSTLTAGDQPTFVCNERKVEYALAA